MMGRVIVRNYRVDVFAAERLVGVGAAEQQLARTGFEEDPDVVLALLLRCQFVSISHFLLLNAGGWGVISGRVSYLAAAFELAQADFIQFGEPFQFLWENQS